MKNYKIAKNISHPIVKGIVKNSCGCYSLDIGLIKQYQDNLQCHCHSEGLVRVTNNVRYFAATSFRPIQESIFPSLTMSRVIEKERELVSMN